MVVIAVNRSSSRSRFPAPIADRSCRQHASPERHNPDPRHRRLIRRIDIAIKIDIPPHVVRAPVDPSLDHGPVRSVRDAIGVRVALGQPKRHAVGGIPVHLALPTGRCHKRDDICVLVLAVVQTLFKRPVARRGPRGVRVLLPERHEVNVRAVAIPIGPRLLVDEALLRV